jgi:hypothetical protein
VLDVEAIYSGGATDADAFLALSSAATDQALADAVHPAVHGTDVPFRVYAEPDALMLDGQVDFFSADALRRALVGAGGDRPIDLAPLRFADHHAARALAESGAPLRGIPYSMRRVWDLLTKAG